MMRFISYPVHRVDKNSLADQPKPEVANNLGETLNSIYVVFGDSFMIPTAKSVAFEVHCKCREEAARIFFLCFPRGKVSSVFGPYKMDDQLVQLSKYQVEVMTTHNYNLDD